MSETHQTHGVNPVANPEVWRCLKTLFIGSLLLFLVNITLGFVNAVTTGALPRWQMLTHLHAGTIGWITVSVIGVAIWFFTGEWDVTDAYINHVKYLVWAGVLVFTGYIASFGVGYFVMGDTLIFLPAFGTAATVVIWGATVFVLRERGNQPVFTASHGLVSAALIVASGGALLGILAGLELAFGAFLPIEPGSVINAHRAPMEVYVYIAGAAIVAWFVQGEDASSWGWTGKPLAGLWAVAGLIIPFAVIPEFRPLGIATFLFGLLLLPLAFIGLVGWRALRTNPFRSGPGAWAFFGTIGLLLFVLVFFIGGLVLGGAEWGSPVMFNIFFVGMMTNLLFGVISSGTADGRTLLEWAEPSAMWLLNLGLDVFVALRIAFENRHGAVLMGLGVLLGVITMLYRLLE